MRTLTTLWMAASYAQFLFATGQDTASKRNFVQQLQATYVQTAVAADNLKVTQAGSVLVIQKDGIGACPATSAIGIALPYENSYKDGKVKQGLKSRLLALKTSSRDLAVGEKVHLTKIEVKGDAIVFHILTCGACDPSAVDPSYVPFKASLTFEFAKGSLATATFDQVQPIIGRVFTVDTPVTTTVTDPILPPPPPPQDPDPVPPPPPAAPIQIGLEQTVEQIVAALGQPETVVKAGDGKEIYLYKALKITLVDGKVTEIQ